MPQKRSDADAFTHPALAHIEAQGITRKQAADILGVPEKLGQLNAVLGRWKATSDQWKKLFHDVFGIPYDDLVDIPVRPDAATFKKQQRKRKKPNEHLRPSGTHR